MNKTMKLGLLTAMLSGVAMVSYADSMPLAEEPTITPMNLTSDKNAELENQAESAPAKLQIESQDFVSAWGVSGQVGTLGLGFNVAHALYSDYLNLRFQANFADYSTSFNVNGSGNNNAKVDFNTYGLLLDYMPWGGVFRFTGGLYYDNRSLTVSGNNVDVGGGQTGSGTAGVNFAPIAPYFGIGIGSQAASSLDKKGFLFAFDAGVLFQDPTAYSNLTCSTSTAGGCDGFAQQNSQWVSDAQTQIDKYGQFWPVLSLSMGYRF